LILALIHHFNQYQNYIFYEVGFFEASLLSLWNQGTPRLSWDQQRLFDPFDQELDDETDVFLPLSAGLKIFLEKASSGDSKRCSERYSVQCFETLKKELSVKLLEMEQKNKENRISLENNSTNKEDK